MAFALHEYFYAQDGIELSGFSHIEPYFSCLYTNPDLQKNISDKIFDENTLVDNASPKLASLRKNRKRVRN